MLLVFCFDIINTLKKQRLKREYMKITELFNVKRPIIDNTNENHKYLLNDLEEAFRNSGSFFHFDHYYSFQENEEYCNAISFKEISKLHFGSDEDSVFRIIRFKGEDVGYMQKSGDTRYWSLGFLSEEKLMKFVLFLHHIDSQFCEYSGIKQYLIKEEEEHHCQYVKLEEKEGDVLIKSFNTFGEWLEKSSKPEIALIEENGVLTEWKIKDHKEANLEGHSIVVERNGMSIHVSPKDIKFKI